MTPNHPDQRQLSHTWSQPAWSFLTWVLWRSSSTLCRCAMNHKPHPACGCTFPLPSSYTSSHCWLPKLPAHKQLEEEVPCTHHPTLNSNFLPCSSRTSNNGTPKHPSGSRKMYPLSDWGISTLLIPDWPGRDTAHRASCKPDTQLCPDCNWSWHRRTLPPNVCPFNLKKWKGNNFFLHPGKELVVLMPFWDYLKMEAR